MKFSALILGFIEVTESVVVTHRDSYLLTNLSVVSVRRPFLGAALMLGGAFSGFGMVFGDLLFPGEIAAAVIASLVAVLTGLFVGQLKLLSRDLRGSELSGVIWGYHGSLNQARAKIVDQLASAKEWRDA